MSFAFDKQIEIRENEPLCKHAYFKIGGHASFAAFPKTEEELLSVIDTAKTNKIKFFIAGNGSNLLFDDGGFDGVVIFTKHLSFVEYLHRRDSTLIEVGCGKNLTELASEAGKKHMLTGLEFAYGIPGSVGGAVYMNAGAYGGQISDLVAKTKYYDTQKNEIVTLSAPDHCFDYRHSIFAEHPEYIVLSTTLEMKEGDPEQILAQMTKNMEARREKQPLELPNAGSTFKRPGGGLFAGKLIEDSGLKGYTVGKAQVSTKHAGFTVNLGGASCADVLAVIAHTKETVLKNFGVELESEIIYVPK